MSMKLEGKLGSILRIEIKGLERLQTVWAVIGSTCKLVNGSTHWVALQRDEVEADFACGLPEVLTSVAPSYETATCNHRSPPKCNCCEANDILDTTRHLSLLTPPGGLSSQEICPPILSDRIPLLQINKLCAFQVKSAINLCFPFMNCLLFSRLAVALQEVLD